jgi:hypothetical protein
VPEQAYSRATLGVYEMTRVELLRDLYVWAYERSTQEYLAIRQDLAEPDPLRLAWRDLIKQTIREVVTQPGVDALTVIQQVIDAQCQRPSVVVCRHWWSRSCSDYMKGCWRGMACGPQNLPLGRINPSHTEPIQYYLREGCACRRLHPQLQCPYHRTKACGAFARSPSRDLEWFERRCREKQPATCAPPIVLMSHF